MPISIMSTAIPDVKLMKSDKIHDERGFFSEVYRRSDFEAAGLTVDFVQENHSLSLPVGTVRGLHFQSHPFAQGKLVRVVRGRVFDVAVDIRRSSPTFAQHVTAELSAENWQQLWIPPGFAHGYCSLEPSCDIIYIVTQYCSKDHDHGSLWNDKDIGICWPVDESSAILSERDRAHPRLGELPAFFS